MIDKDFKRISYKRVSELFNIPYSTICDWNSNRKKNDLWRKGLIKFLSSLSEKEIEAIKNRSQTIDEIKEEQ